MTAPVAAAPVVVARRPRSAAWDARAERAKRTLDVVVALALLLAALPFLVLAAAAVKAADGGPVLYRQRRVGRGGRSFEMLKLRTMVVGADRLVPVLAARNARDGLLFKVVGDPRVTPVGRVLRRFAIDELPQLWNVLRGDMSLVGPRPLPVDPAAFTRLEQRRHSVRPGITGRWQVHGGDTYREMIEHDLAYIGEWSLVEDVRLLVRTVPAVLARRVAC